MKTIPINNITKTIIPILILGMLSSCSRNNSGSGLPGYLESEFLYISADRSHLMSDLAVHRGQSISKGEHLFTLDSEIEQRNLAEIQSRMASLTSRIADAQKGQRPEEIAILHSQIAEAEKTYDFAGKEFHRAEQLFEAGSITQSRFDSVTNQFDQATERLNALKNQFKVAQMGQRQDQIEALIKEKQALEEQLKLANWNLEQCTVYSKIDALVHDTLFQASELVPAGSPVVVLQPKDKMKVIFFVPNDRLAQAQIGGSIQITTDSLEIVIPATINYISTRAEYTPPVIFSRELSDDLVFRVEAILPTEWANKLYPGMPVQVEIQPISIR